MKARLGLALATAALIGGSSFLAIQAVAQNAPPAEKPAEAAPASPPANPHAGHGNMGAAAETGGQMGRMERQRGEQGAQRQQRQQMSPEDRTAFFEARLASIRAGLMLNADQEKLWPAIESAARNMVKTMAELREKARNATPPANPFERMKAFGEASSARGAAMTRMADAMLPLYATLTDDQKRRYRMLSGGMMAHPDMAQMQRGQGRMDMMQRGGERRQMMERGRDHHDMRGRDDRDDRRGYDRRGRDEERRGMRDRNEDRGGWRGREDDRRSMRGRDDEDRRGRDRDDRRGRDRGDGDEMRRGR